METQTSRFTKKRAFRRSLCLCELFLERRYPTPLTQSILWVGRGAMCTPLCLGWPLTQVGAGWSVLRLELVGRQNRDIRAAGADDLVCQATEDHRVKPECRVATSVGRLDLVAALIPGVGALAAGLVAGGGAHVGDDAVHGGEVGLGDGIRHGAPWEVEVQAYGRKLGVFYHKNIENQ